MSNTIRDNSFSRIIILALLDALIVTIVALMMRYERWLSDRIGLTGAEILIVKTVALLLVGIFLIQVIKLSWQRHSTADTT